MQTRRIRIEGNRAETGFMGVSAEEAMSLDDKLSILDEELFGLPEGMSEEDRERYEQVMPEEPRKTGTARDRMPEIEAGPLPDGRGTYLLTRSVLSIFAGTIDMMLENLAPSWNGPGRSSAVLGSRGRGGRERSRASGPRGTSRGGANARATEVAGAPKDLGRRQEELRWPLPPGDLRGVPERPVGVRGPPRPLPSCAAYLPAFLVGSASSLLTLGRMPW